MQPETVETRKLSLLEIEELLKANKVIELVGVEETGYFEFREHTYHTPASIPNYHKSQLELVRDVTSMANSGGGLICIGLKSAKKASERTEYVAEVTGIKRENVYMESWQGILSDMVIPRFSHDWLSYGYVKHEEKEVLWIKIEDAKSFEAYPLMLAKDQWDPGDNRSVKGLIFGIYHRDGAENVLMSSENIRRHIAEGVPADSSGKIDISSRIVTMDAKLDALLLHYEEERSHVTFSADEREKKMVDYAKNVLDDGHGFFIFTQSRKNR